MLSSVGCVGLSVEYSVLVLNQVCWPLVMNTG